MTVVELRRILSGLPGDMIVLTIEDSYLTPHVDAQVRTCAKITKNGSVLRLVRPTTPNVVPPLREYLVIS